MKPIPKYIAILLVIIGFYACASTGSPDGGPYDEDPPKFIRAIPNRLVGIQIRTRRESRLLIYNKVG